MSLNVLNKKKLQEQRESNIKKEDWDNKVLSEARDLFSDKIKSMDNKFFALFLIKHHKVEPEIIKQGNYCFPRFHLGISAFSNSINFNNEELKKSVPYETRV